jgi:hypothetical protein
MAIPAQLGYLGAAVTLRLPHALPILLGCPIAFSVNNLEGGVR